GTKLLLFWIHLSTAPQGTEMRPVADPSWVDFITTAIADPELDQIRERCLNWTASSRRCAAGNTAIRRELQCCVTSHVTSDLKIDEHLTPNCHSPPCRIKSMHLQ